jgi:hypothetical protein
MPRSLAHDLDRRGRPMVAAAFAATTGAALMICEIGASPKFDRRSRMLRRLAATHVRIDAYTRKEKAERRKPSRMVVAA